MQSEDVKKLANLARIDLTEEELQKMPDEINSILGYVKNISEAADAQGESRIESAGTSNVTRTDEFDAVFSDNKNLVDAAPESQDNYVKVKKVL